MIIGTIAPKEQFRILCTSKYPPSQGFVAKKLSQNAVIGATPALAVVA
jgi:hypothetical protein